jgi:6-phosphogluconolactonase
MPEQPPDIHISDDPARAVADLMADQAARGGSIVLTGGSSPVRAYHLVASLEPDWGEVSVWWGDERCVPPEDDRSNYKLAADSLLNRLETPPAEVHRIRGELPPQQAADHLDAELAGVTLDFMLLGLGSDGHMASLFPGSPQLAVSDRRAVSGPAGLDPYVDRVTMTLPTIQAAKRIVFLVTGDDKADAVAGAFGAPVSEAVPASLARLAPTQVEVFLDSAAGSKLPPR